MKKSNDETIFIHGNEQFKITVALISKKVIILVQILNALSLEVKRFWQIRSLIDNILKIFSYSQQKKK